MQPHWVGDLTVSMQLVVRRPAGRLRFELIKGGRPHRCEIDLASGLATLSRDDSPPSPAADAGSTGRGPTP